MAEGRSLSRTYLSKVLFTYDQSRLDEISDKTDTIDAVAGRVKGLPIQELLARVDTLQANVGRTSNDEYVDSSSGFVAQMEGRVNELDSSEKTLLDMINGMSEDFRATLDVVKNGIADVNTKLSLTMRAMANQVSIEGAVPVTKATNTVTDEAKVTLAMMYLREDAKLWWRVQDLMSAYAAAKRLFDLTSNFQDVRSHQSSSSRRNRNSRSSSPKDARGDKDSGRDHRLYQLNIENTWRRLNNRSPPKRPLSFFICKGPHLARECTNKVDFHAFQASLIPDLDGKSNQAEGEVGQIEREARCLRLRWGKDSRIMKVVNYVALPVVGLVKQTVIRLGGWKGPVDFVVVKMDDFDVVLGMEFLLEHQVIPMLSAKCLVITGSFPTVVPADIRQPNGFKMISAMQLDKSPVQEELPFAAILLGALGKLGRKRTDHGIEPPSEAKASAKNAYRTTPLKLVVLQKQSKKLLGTGVSRPVQAPWGAPVLSLKKKDRSLRWCIGRRIQNKLTIRRRYPFSLLLNLFDRSRGVKYFPKSDIRPRYCRVRAMEAVGLEATGVTGLRTYEFPVAFNDLKQAMIEGPSLGVIDATKPPKVKTEQFNCVLEEYLHHFVDGRQKDWVQLLNITQFGHGAQIESLIKRSQFEIKGSRYYVLSSLTDGSYIGNSSQVCRVEKKREQMADIAQVCLEEASRAMEERVDQKRCPFKFEWMTKLRL
ncbi:uncharacterized protein E5676_scaffold265G00940 [Cucumis melo var. makuwa]|uniref:Reverse transcriptase n=1 Tax=Cucumis melo var. makuwa TaxID=1194695 RepID=A0A5D3CC75_CUCMM|nr:uncharacterized protein E5676_scaffold265G00940 [Cucumis melo var. makuwa]